MKSNDLTKLVTILTVGCDKYIHLHELHNVKSDLERIHEILIKSDYSVFSTNQIIQIYNKSSTDLRDTLTNYICSRSAEQDILILFFAGHGTAVGRDDFGFCMNDAYLHPEDNVILPTSVVKLSEIIGTLNIKNVSLILIVDACYSGLISKKVQMPFPEISVEMSRLLVTYSGSFYGLISSCSSYEQVEDFGVISKALKDIFEQGITDNEPFITFKDLSENLTERIDRYSKGQAKSRIFIPQGRISRLPIYRNVQYIEPLDHTNVYSFTKPYLELLEVLWNNGNSIMLTPAEILEKTGSQSSYANHKKLSYEPWNLLRTNKHGQRMLTENGKKFLSGEITIPKSIEVNRISKRSQALPGTKQLIVVEKKNLFGENERVFQEM